MRRPLKVSKQEMMDSYNTDVTAGTESTGKRQEILMNQQNIILPQHYVNVKTSDQYTSISL